VNVLPGSPECSDASACLKVCIPVIRRGCPHHDQFACPLAISPFYVENTRFDGSASSFERSRWRSATGPEGTVLSTNQDLSRMSRAEAGAALFQ
jgi:hypothetical protein